MNHKQCKDCRQYIQHYTFNDHLLFRVNCGHCVLPEMRKTKRPDTKACNQFEPRDPEENAFVTKEYLSKPLLERVLSMELLPEIKDE